MIVAGLNPQGEPDFYFCKVKCTFEEAQEREHYLLAEKKATEDGFEPHISMSEDDPGGIAIVDKFIWDSASEYTV